MMERRDDELQKTESKSKQLSGKQSSSSSSSSPASSPNHEFSFTISLSKPTPNSFALDLSPADDIFFHGHLLPLHLLSHLPLSPRSSTASIDNLNLTHQNTINFPDNLGSFDSSHSYNINTNNIVFHKNSSINSNNSSSSCSMRESITNNNTNSCTSREGIKSKSFSSIFGLTRTRKEIKEDIDEKEKQKRTRMRLDLMHVVKRYLKFFRGRRDHHQKINGLFHGKPNNYNSYSGNLMVSPRNKRDVVRGRRGEYSAPASMRTSPTNSGILQLTASSLSPQTDSTMEDLQAAIQSAIAHCKNSIAKEDKLRSC